MYFKQKQTQHAMRMIRADFEKLHQFLRDEEASILASVKEEDEHKSHKTKDKIDRLTEESSFLIEIINSTEEAMALEDTEFIKVTLLIGFKTTIVIRYYWLVVFSLKAVRGMF